MVVVVVVDVINTRHVIIVVVVVTIVIFDSIPNPFARKSNDCKYRPVDADDVDNGIGDDKALNIVAAPAALTMWACCGNIATVPTWHSSCGCRLALRTDSGMPSNRKYFAGSNSR